MTNRKFTHPKDAEEGHKWQTVDGRKARIYVHDAGGDHPIHGAIWNEQKGRWFVAIWTKVGGACADGTRSLIDLVDAPRMVKVQGYLNVYPGGHRVLHRNKELADRFAGDRIACIKIDMEVPEGRFDE